VRLGRDGDIEEWLATDLHLDRPVLVRLLGPEVDSDRRAGFLVAVGEAAQVSHPYLAPVFAAEEVEGGAYYVTEWTGGVTLSSRMAAGETIDPSEFLVGATGLASALTTLHRAGVVHGAIDPGAISYRLGSPPRLGAFGRHRRHASAAADVIALASALEQGLTGRRPGGAPPSQVMDGMPPGLDAVLDAAQRGELTASGLATRLAELPPKTEPPPPDPAWARRGIKWALILVVAALALIATGWLLGGGGTGVSTTLPGGGAGHATEVHMAAWVPSRR
jgi:serine/threonine protein kinase